LTDSKNDAEGNTGGCASVVRATESAEEAAKVRREKWTHEDALINHRLTWLLASQTLLLGAYGLLYQRLTDWFYCPDAKQLHHLKFMLEAIPWIGFVTSLLLLGGVVAALVAMQFIRNEAGTGNSPEVSTWTTGGGWAAGGLLPVVFCGSWLFIHCNQATTGITSEATDKQTVECHPDRLERQKREAQKAENAPPAPLQPIVVTCTSATAKPKPSKPRGEVGRPNGGQTPSRPNN
jgi:hypothetical protein